MTQFKYTCEDGEVELTDLMVLRDVKTIEVGSPHEGSKCSLRIDSLTNLSTGQTKTDEGIVLAESNYYPSGVELELSRSLPVTIGITSVSELDRLIDVCLTKLHVGETGTFKIMCSRSKSSYNMSLSLMSIEESVEWHKLPKERILEIATLLKEQGVELFSKGCVIDAFFKFSKAIKYLCLFHPRTMDSQQSNLVSSLRSNMASCHVKTGNWEDAIDLCNLVLQQEPNNVKALYRRGWSYIEIQEHERANNDLMKAQQLDPGNQAVKNKLTILNDKKKALNAKYAQAMKKLFS